MIMYNIGFEIMYESFSNMDFSGLSLKSLFILVIIQVGWEPV